MMYAPLRLLFKLYASIQPSLAGAERVFSILDLEEEKIKGGTKELANFNQSIVFENVSFKYPSRSTFIPVLDGTIFYRSWVENRSIVDQ